MPETTQVRPEIVDPKRLASLRSTGLLDSPPEKEFDGLTDLVSRLLKAPTALVSLVDTDRQFFKSACGLPEPWATKRQTKLSHSFCQHVVSSREALVVNNAPEHPVVRDNLAVRDLGVMAYLGIPLFTPDDECVGSLCAIDGTARTWSEDDVNILSVLADAVMNEIAVRMYVDQINFFTETVVLSNEQLERNVSDLKFLCARYAAKGVRAQQQLPTGLRPLKATG